MTADLSGSHGDGDDASTVRLDASTAQLAIPRCDQEGVSMPGVCPMWMRPLRCWHWESEDRLLEIARLTVSRECAKLGVSPDVADEAGLAVNELMCNAVQHGLGPYELRLYADPPGWGVADCADGIAIIRTYLDKAGQEPTLAELAEEHGRGLRIVGNLFRCDIHPTVYVCGRRGKEVTFSLPETCRDPRQP